MITDLIGHFVVPSGIIALLILLSLVLVTMRRTRPWAPRAAIAALFLYAAFGNGYVAYLLLGPLERAYPPVTDAATIGPVDVIVVLTGYASLLPEVSPPSWVNDSTAYRILEAQWLRARFPDASTLISGTGRSAVTMRELLLSLGYAADEVSVDQDSIDTGLSASNLAQSLAAGQSCALVTSAGHMPRAMLAFEHAGVACAPVPTELYTPFPLTWLDVLPSPGKLRLSDLAVHEYLGILWYWIRGRI